MPCNYADYPEDWKTVVRPRVLLRDQNRCKFCGLENQKVGYRDSTGDFHVADDGDILDNPDGVKLIKIVLTIAHLDGDTRNNEDQNLAALCQRCHLRHDRDQHARSRVENRDKRAGQSLIA